MFVSNKTRYSASLDPEGNVRKNFEKKSWRKNFEIFDRKIFRAKKIAIFEQKNSIFSKFSIEKNILKNQKNVWKKMEIFGEIFQKFRFFSHIFRYFFEFLEYFFDRKFRKNQVFLLENCDFFARNKFSIENFEVFSSTFFFKFFSNITSGFQRCRISSFIRNKQVFPKKSAHWTQMKPPRSLKPCILDA